MTRKRMQIGVYEDTQKKLDKLKERYGVNTYSKMIEHLVDNEIRRQGI